MVIVPGHIGDNMPTTVIAENKIKCMKCETVITSIVDNMFKSCACGRVRIAGGNKDQIRTRVDNSPAVEGVDYMEQSVIMFND